MSISARRLCAACEELAPWLPEATSAFGADSLLLFANGSQIPLAAAAVGMRVGSALGEGTITQVLAHPIHKLIQIFRHRRLWWKGV